MAVANAKTDDKIDDKADAKARPAAQGDNPADRHNAPGVTPVTLQASDTVAPAAAGADPDALLRSAKHQLAAADVTGDDHAHDQVDRAAKARALVVERNSADPARVKAIDSELEALGFDAPLPTTEAQRAPVGRRAPGKTTA